MSYKPSKTEKKLIHKLENDTYIRFKISSTEDEDIITEDISKDLDGKGAILVLCEKNETRMVARVTGKQFYEVILSMLSSFAEDNGIHVLELLDQIAEEFEDEPVDQLYKSKGNISKDIH